MLGDFGGKHKEMAARSKPKKIDLFHRLLLIKKLNLLAVKGAEREWTEGRAVNEM